MFRRYNYGHLKNHNSFRLGVASPSSVWSLPPRTVAEFAGELSQIMLNAVEAYVHERCLLSATRNFKREIARTGNTPDHP